MKIGHTLSSWFDAAKFYLGVFLCAWIALGFVINAIRPILWGIAWLAIYAGTLIMLGRVDSRERSLLAAAIISLLLVLLISIQFHIPIFPPDPPGYIGGDYEN